MTPEQFKNISNAIQQLKTLSNAITDANLKLISESLNSQLISDIVSIKTRIDDVLPVLQNELNTEIENANRRGCNALVAKCAERILNLVSIIKSENIKFDALEREYIAKYAHFESMNISPEKIAVVLPPFDDAVKNEHRQKIAALQLEQEKLSAFINDFPRYDTSLIEQYLSNLA